MSNDLADPAWVTRLTGGLIVAPPTVDRFVDGRSAARAIAVGPLGLELVADDPPQPDLVADFGRRFPVGIVYRVDHPTPAGLAAFDSRERASVLRDGLRFARDLEAPPWDGGRFDVSALAEDGVLRLLFLVPATERAAARRAWRRAIRDRTLRAAVLGPRGRGGML